MKWISAAAFALLLSLAAPSAWAEQGEGGHDTNTKVVDIFGPVQLVLHDGSRFRPRGLLLAAPEPVEIPIPTRVAQRDENKIDLRSLPVLGSLFKPGAEAEFAGARRVAEAYRSDDHIVIATGEPVISTVLLDGVRQVVIANREVSFRMPQDFLRQATPLLDDLPAIGGLFRMGPVYKKSETLLIVITPSLIDPAE